MRYILVFLLLSGVCLGLSLPREIVEESERMCHLHIHADYHKTVTVHVDDVRDWRIVTSSVDNEITLVRRPLEVKDGK